MLGKVYNKVKIQGEDFIPLQPKSLHRDADNPKKVTVKFHVPVPPLALDTLTMPKIVSYGFYIYHKRTAQTITSVKVIGDDAVEITCADDLTEDIELTYAGQNANGQGNLRDSDPYQAVFNYVDIDRKVNGVYVYPRNDNRTLRPAYEPRDAQGQIIYNKPYPLYNFSVGFYYRLPKGENNLQILSGTDNLQSVKENNEFRIYPNPVKNELIIDNGKWRMNNEEWTITDLSGKSVMSQKLSVIHYPLSINVSTLPAGVYILKIGDERGKFVKI
jgi:hypothetical protein